MLTNLTSKALFLEQSPITYQGPALSASRIIGTGVI